MALKRFIQTPPADPTRDYDVANKKYVDDHTAQVEAAGSGTAGKMVKWQTSAIVEDASNTDTQVADAVSKAHVAATAGSGISVAGQVVTNSDKGTDARTAHEVAYGHTTTMASLTMGLDAAKPGSGFTGLRFYFATDTKILYVDTGAAWVAIVGVFA